MTFHSQADDVLTGRCAQRRKIDNNTWYERRDANIAVRLHNTDILLYSPDGWVTYDTGGWMTVTTKDRMNKFGPLHIHSTRGEWTLGGQPYIDGISYNPENGRWSGVLDHDDHRARQARNEATRRQITKFVKSITPEQIIDAWDNPGGDCLLCRFDSTNCLESHISDDEMYFHATLAHRAIKASNYNSPEAIMSMIYHYAQRGEVDELLTRTLGKFLRKNLLEGVAVQ